MKTSKALVSLYIRLYGKNKILNLFKCATSNMSKKKKTRKTLQRLLTTKASLYSLLSGVYAYIDLDIRKDNDCDGLTFVCYGFRLH